MNPLLGLVAGLSIQMTVVMIVVIVVTMLEIVQDIREVVVVADVDPGQDPKAVDAIGGLVLAALGQEAVPGIVPVHVPLRLREVAAVPVLITNVPDLGPAPIAIQLVNKMEIIIRIRSELMLFLDREVNFGCCICVFCFMYFT
ncbi:hypothetical protein WA026_006195 [Henosepilachna vigintioctopunctata]|uniref:Secreted protein n=1 Tax=Henosepilachna vigintioctopunctata TaxID=420089 RepID=A0AAW1TJQ8_9CUCU